MILYLTTNENSRLLDGLVEKINIPISKINEQKNLNRMILRDMSNFSHISYFVIDLSAISDGEKEIMQAIHAFRTMYDSRVIVIAGRETSEQLISLLIGQKVYNIVSLANPNSLEEQLKKCFSADGMSKQDVENIFAYTSEPLVETSEKDSKTHEEDIRQKEKEKPMRNAERGSRYESAPEEPQRATRQSDIRTEAVFKRKNNSKVNATIAVSGTQEHIGTTHHALMIAKFLQNSGFKVCYLEANKNKSVATLEYVYNINKDTNHTGLVQYEGIDMYYGYIFPEVAAKGYEFFVFDFGAFDEQMTEVILTKDIKIFVGGSKSWELMNYSKVIDSVAGYKDLNFIVNFMPREEKNIMLELIKAYKKSVYYAEYAPYIFDKSTNASIYSKIFKDFVEEFRDSMSADGNIADKKTNIFENFKLKGLENKWLKKS